ncbi:hypothetical protein GTA08_BOTSDO01343, partial [Neofusicoccum parvum]
MATTTDTPPLQNDHPQTSRRPTSPYASPIVYLTFSTSPQRWPIHSAFLTRHPKLHALLQQQQQQQQQQPPSPPSSSPPPQTSPTPPPDPHLHLDHADPQSAHTLLHHLTTGRYQALRSPDATTEYERALLAHGAAGWHGLRALRAQAAAEAA